MRRRHQLSVGTKLPPRTRGSRLSSIGSSTVEQRLTAAEPRATSTGPLAQPGCSDVTKPEASKKRIAVGKPGAMRLFCRAAICIDAHSPSVGSPPHHSIAQLRPPPLLLRRAKFSISAR